MMSKKNKIALCVSVVFAFTIFMGLSFLSAFEWPQSPVRANALFSEMRGDGFNTGMIFSTPGEVFAAEAGSIVMLLENDSSNMGWFESPLGNSVIVSHKNDMISVYSNLVNVKVGSTNRDIALGDVIGVSGDSAWREGSDGAGFQVIDTKMKTLINPIVLMSQAPTSNRVNITGVVAVDRKGERFPMYNGATLKSGAYVLYMERAEVGMIHSSSVSLNGEVKESVNYDTLKQEQLSLTVTGSKSYTFDEIYPQEDTMRLAEVPLSRGTNTIEILLNNVGGTESFSRFRISVN